ncbi:MAG: U-box domain-containing protein [Pseudomonadota bacterium]|nr:U-box domain-containing protein [Pseudomonadota bacterium]
MTIREIIHTVFNSFAEFCVNVLGFVQRPAPLTIQRGQRRANRSSEIENRIERGQKLLDLIKEKKVSTGTVNKLKVVEKKCQNKDYDWGMHMDEMETLIEGKQDEDSLLCPLTYRPFIDPVITQTTCEGRTVKKTYERSVIERCLRESKLDPFNRQPIIGDLKQDTTTINQLNKIISEANHVENTTRENTQSFWRKWFGSSTPDQAEKSSGGCQTSVSTKEKESEEQKKERLLKKLCDEGTLSSEESSWLEAQDLDGNGRLSESPAF